MGVLKDDAVGRPAGGPMIYDLPDFKVGEAGETPLTFTWKTRDSTKTSGKMTMTLVQYKCPETQCGKGFSKYIPHGDLLRSVKVGQKTTTGLFCPCAAEFFNPIQAIPKRRRRMAQREFSNRRDSPVMVRLLQEIVRANQP